MSTTDNLEKMLADGKDSALLRFGLGSAYFNEKNFAAAIPHLQACLAQDANYSAAYKLLGRSLSSTGDNAQARDIFHQGLSVAEQAGDKQAAKEMAVFLRKLEKA